MLPNKSFQRTVLRAAGELRRWCNRDTMTQDQKELLSFFKDLIKPVWRLCAGIALIQISGAIVGFIQQPIGFIPIDLWYGVAYATPVGFVVGFTWQSISCPGSLSENAVIVWFLAAASIVLPLFGYLTTDMWQSEFVH